MHSSSPSPRQDNRLDADWRTTFGDIPGAESPTFNDSNWKTVSVPHNWEDYQGYRQKSHGNLHGTAWYRRTFALDPSEGDRRVFLGFEGVGSYAKVWVNGHYLGEHKGGRTCFEFDITDAVDWGKTNIVAVRADHPEKIQDLPYVCGGCWGSPNTEGSQPIGIFRPVHLLITGPFRVEPFGVHVWTPEISERRAIARVQTEVKNYSTKASEVTLRSEILNASGKALATMNQVIKVSPGQTALFGQTSPEIKNPHLWSLDDPYLHRVRTTVLVDGSAADSVTTRFGMRWLEWPVGSIGDNERNLTIDPEKLQEQPTSQNNYFTVKTGGQNDAVIRIAPGGVQILIPSCDSAAATVRVKTSVTNSDTGPHRVRLTSFIRNFAGTKFVYSMETDHDLAPGETFAFDQTTPAINFPELWSPENPALHVLETTIQDPANAGGKKAIIYDRAETSFGIFATTELANKANAYVESSAPQGDQVQHSGSKQFLLNGKPIFINGTAEYEHLLGSDHAFADEQILARVKQIKAAGFKGEPVDAWYMYRANYAPKSSQPMVYLVSHTWPDASTDRERRATSWCSPIAMKSNCSMITKPPRSASRSAD